MAVKADVAEAAHKLGDDLRNAGVRALVDDRTDVQFGRRVVDWELKGVPLRLELGPRDVAAGQVTVAHRLSGGKEPLALAGLATAIVGLLDREQQRMLDGARELRDAQTVNVANVADAIEACSQGQRAHPFEASRPCQ